MSKVNKHPICKFCKQSQPDFVELQLHCEIEHNQEYKAIQQWLGKTVEPKLKALEAIAREGLGVPIREPIDE
jgi:hypothetical protein